MLASQSFLKLPGGNMRLFITTLSLFFIFKGTLFASSAKEPQLPCAELVEGNPVEAKLVKAEVPVESPEEKAERKKKANENLLKGAQNLDLRLIKQAFKNGANVNCQFTLNKQTTTTTALFEALKQTGKAAEAGDRDSCVKEILKYDPNFYAKNPEGFTAFNYALLYNYSEIALLIWNNFKKVFEKSTPHTKERNLKTFASRANKSNWTPLHHAIYWGFTEMVRELTEAQARTFILPEEDQEMPEQIEIGIATKTLHKMSALDLAYYQEILEIRTLVLKEHLRQNPSLTTESFSKHIGLAVRRGELEILRMLGPLLKEEINGNFNYANRGYEETISNYAVCNRQVTILRYLVLFLGADVHSPNPLVKVLKTIWNGGIEKDISLYKETVATLIELGAHTYSRGKTEKIYLEKGRRYYPDLFKGHPRTLKESKKNSFRPTPFAPRIKRIIPPSHEELRKKYAHKYVL